jgi:hypothetical protein
VWLVEPEADTAFGYLAIAPRGSRHFVLIKVHFPRTTLSFQLLSSLLPNYSYLISAFVVKTWDLAGRISRPASKMASARERGEIPSKNAIISNAKHIVSNVSSQHQNYAFDLAKQQIQIPLESSQGPSAADTSSPTDSQSTFRTVTILIALYLTLFATALDQTIIATAIPTITTSLKSASGYTWFVLCIHSSSFFCSV